MHLSVKQRIATAMAVLVAVNAAAAVLTVYYQSEASKHAAQAHEQSVRARKTSSAAQHVARFSSDANAFALAVSRSSVSEDLSTSYGSTQGSEHDADLALTALAGEVDAEIGSRITLQWQDLRLATYHWINREAEAADAPLRVTVDDSGRFRASVTSNLAVPAQIASLDDDTLRRTIRQQAAALESGTLRILVRDSEEAAARAAGAEARARDRVVRASLALIGLSLVLALTMATWLYRTIATPLATAKGFAERVASGDLSADFGSHTHDEIGSLTRAIESMRNAVVTRMSTMQEMAGVVLVTAEGVAESAQHARTVIGNHDAPDELASTIDRVSERADVLREIATQLITE